MRTLSSSSPPTWAKSKSKSKSKSRSRDKDSSRDKDMMTAMVRSALAGKRGKDYRRGDNDDDVRSASSQTQQGDATAAAAREERSAAIASRYADLLSPEMDGGRVGSKNGNNGNGGGEVPVWTSSLYNGAGNEQQHDIVASTTTTSSSSSGSILQNIEVRSVDGYQGREKHTIVFSAVRSNRWGRVGFLRDWRRLNVALTRPRNSLVVVGDARTLRSDRSWRAFIEWCEREGVYSVRGEGGKNEKEKEKKDESGDG
jgi:hypothetical protein